MWKQDVLLASAATHLLVVSCTHSPTFQASSLASFLTPMLEFVPEQRATAAEMLSHPWLQGNPEEEEAFLAQVGLSRDCQPEM
jgi:serine/threonine protein kinase